MRGVPQIEVTFDIDVNGILNVSAKDLATGKEQSITITASSNMSDKDIERAMEDAKVYESEDQEKNVMRSEVIMREKICFIRVRHI